MKFKFFHPVPKYQVSKLKFWQGVLIGIGSAFSFYGLLYILRESIRLSSSHANNFSVWIISEQDVQSWNLIFAMIAVIFGQSLAIKHMFSSPKLFRGQRKLLSIRVVTDATVLTNYFLYWLSILLFSFFFYYATVRGYFEEPNMEYHWFVWGLIIIVLVLEQWKSLRLFHNKVSFKNMLLSIVFLLVFAFTLSQINIVDYKKINFAINSNKPVIKHKIELPVVKNYSRYIERTRVWVTCPFIENTDSIGSQIIQIDNQTLIIDSIPNYIEKKGYWYFCFKLNFDKRNKLNVFKTVLSKLAEGNNNRVLISVFPDKNILDPRRLNRGYFVSYRNPSKQLISNIGEEVNRNFFNSCVFIQILPDKQILVENKKVDLKDLEVVLKQLLPKNDGQSIVINADDNCNFQNYMIVYDSILSFKRERMDNISAERFTNTYYELNYYDYIEVQKFGLSINPLPDSVFYHYYPKYR